MRPNMEEYEDVEDAQPVSSRAMSWAVLAVAVGGFAALAYYAYNSGSKATAEGEMMVVEAEGSPIKEAPIDPEGEEFPHQDKTIYDAIAQNSGSSAGEKLLPEAEQPIAAAGVEDSEDSAPVAVPPTVAPQPAPSTTTFVAKEPVVAAPAPVAEPKPEVSVPVEPSPSNPRIINEKKIVVKKPAPVVAKKEPAKEPVKAVVKEPAKEVAEQPVTEPVTEVIEEVVTNEAPNAPEAPVKEVKPAESGVYKIQLGAFKSEQEAQAAWTKIRGKHASALTGSPAIIKADLPNGTFYRLRTGSYGSKAAASAACGRMSGQACMAVK